MTSENTSSPSIDSSSVMKMDELSTIQTTDPNEYSTNESLIPRNELLALSALNNTQQNPVPTITFNEAEQFPAFETYPDMLNYENEYYPEELQQFNESSYGNEFPNDISSFNGADYNFNSELERSFTIPKDFETNDTEILQYDEIISEILQDNNDISHVQHAPLFGCAAGNLFNFTPYGFDLLGTNDADNTNLSVTDDNHCSGQPVIMGLTHDGNMIIDSLNIPINKTMNNINQRNASNINVSDEKIVSLSMSQIPENLNEKDQSVKYANSNEVVTGLTEHEELIIANTIDNCSQVTTNLVPVIMGLTSSGQIICDGCVSDIVPDNVQMKWEKTIENNEDNAANFNIIGNLTAENQEVIVGLIDSSTANGSLFRRDSC